MKKIFLIIGLLAVVFVCMAVVRKPVTSVAEILVQSGSSVTAGDGTVTNTFTITYSAIPNVVASQYGLVVSVTNTVINVTVSGFVYKSALAAVSNQWIAVGAP